MLPEHEWLPIAQKCAVGMHMRVRHGRESRANMTVWNERGRWRAYCQRCKDGGVVHKEHVLLTPIPDDLPCDLEVPTDMRPVIGSEYEDAVHRFLAGKGMAFPYLPKLWYSVAQRRVCLQDPDGGWHGRDLTGRSAAKWLHYGKPSLVGFVGPHVIVTEDLFSMYKVQYAIKADAELRQYGVVSTLGAGCSAAAALALKNCISIVWAYDGDDAGDSGYKSASKRMRAFGSKQSRARPPDGADPKDMQCGEIRELIKRCKNDAQGF